MNNFASPASDPDTPKKVPKHLEQLVTDIFRGLFPPINPQSTPLSNIKRVLLLNRVLNDDETYTIIVRHYAITTKATGLSRPLRRLNTAEKLLNSKKSKGLPNLGKMADIADFMIGGEDGEGYMTDATSGSEVDTDAEVEIAETRMKKVLTRKQREQPREETANGRSGVEKRAVKLVELGPRMKLRMTKVEDGVCNGKVMWHEYISKTKEEMKELDQVWEKRRQEKAARQKIQKDNVERKKAAKGPAKDDDDDDDEEMIDEWE
jgi:ribosome biogenesis protein SSF1/2